MRFKSILSAGLLLAGTAHAQVPEPAEPVKSLARALLQQMIETNTTHAQGNTGLAQAMVDRFHAAGFAPEDIALVAPPEHPEKADLVVRLRGAGKARPMLYIGHLDVVEAKREDWTVDPFTLVEKDGWFYGRGTSDMKGDDAALATALIRLKSEAYLPDRDIIAAFTADEEAGGNANGVDYLLRNRRDLVDAAFAVNPDAGGGADQGDKHLYMGVQSSEKIYVTFRLEATNKGGHSSLPEKDNAIYRLAAALGRVEKLEFPVRLNATTRGYFTEMAKLESGHMRQDMLAVSGASPDPAAARRLEARPFYNAMLRTTCVVTQIEGGHAENALPQRARAAIQCRMLPDDDAKRIQAMLVAAIKDPAIAVTVISPAAPSPESVIPPLVMNRVKGVVQGMWAGLPVAPVMDAGASDSIHTRGAGIPTYGISGLFTDLDDVRAHGRDERISVAGYYHDVEFTYRLIKTLSSAE